MPWILDPRIPFRTSARPIWISLARKHVIELFDSLIKICKYKLYLKKGRRPERIENRQALISENIKSLVEESKI
jgi:hypothetical protein